MQIVSSQDVSEMDSRGHAQTGVDGVQAGARSDRRNGQLGYLDKMSERYSNTHDNPYLRVRDIVGPNPFADLRRHATDGLDETSMPRSKSDLVDLD